MPIRFRCSTCRRLLGIASRKAGAGIQCPYCKTNQLVPTEVTATIPPSGGRQTLPERPRPPKGGTTAPIKSAAAPSHKANGHGPSAAPPPKPPESLPLFERPDFESLLNPAVKQAVLPPPTPPATPRPVPVAVQETPPRSSYSPIPAPAPSPLPPATDEEAYDLEPVGMVLSTTTLTVMAVVVVVLIALAFVAGYLLAAARLPAAG